jgi:uncharacterized membrane protein HdeD (DUF308 family)
VAATRTALFVVFFPLAAVGSMASLAFLIVYGTVSAGHLRVYRDTGAKAWLLVLAVILNAALFALLLGYTIHTGPASTWVTLLAVLALSFVFEIVYRKRTGRSLKSSRLPSARLLYANVEWARQEVCARRAISPRLRVLCALAPRSRGVRIATAWR